MARRAFRIESIRNDTLLSPAWIKFVDAVFVSHSISVVHCWLIVFISIFFLSSCLSHLKFCELTTKKKFVGLLIHSAWNELDIQYGPFNNIIVNWKMEQASIEMNSITTFPTLWDRERVLIRYAVDDLTSTYFFSSSFYQPSVVNKCGTVFAF